MSSTLVGLRHPVIALQDEFRAGSILGAWADLLHTGDAYSAAEKQRCERIKRNCTPRNKKHKGWNARRVVRAWFVAFLIVRAHYHQFHQLKTIKKSLIFRPKKTVLSPLTSEVLYKTKK